VVALVLVVVTSPLHHPLHAVAAFQLDLLPQAAHPKHPLEEALREVPRAVAASRPHHLLLVDPPRVYPKGEASAPPDRLGARSGHPGSDPSPVLGAPQGTVALGAYPHHL